MAPKAMKKVMKRPSKATSSAPDFDRQAESDHDNISEGLGQPSSSAASYSRASAKLTCKVPVSLARFQETGDWNHDAVQGFGNFRRSLQKAGFTDLAKQMNECKDTASRKTFASRLCLVKTDADLELIEEEERGQEHKKKFTGGPMTKFQVWKLLDLPIVAETAEYSSLPCLMMFERSPRGLTEAVVSVSLGCLVAVLYSRGLEAS